MSLATKLEDLSEHRLNDLTMTLCRSISQDLVDGGNEQVMKNELKRLAPWQLDILMKVIYVCLANDYKNSTAYFKWHSAVHDAGGPGCLVRALSDKMPKME